MSEAPAPANRRKFSRRRFLVGAVLLSPFLVGADAKWVEPGWLKLRRVRLGKGKATHRFVHFTDVHHKGDKAYLESVIKLINSVSPEFVCFTGDLIEDRRWVDEALSVFCKIKSPLYGVPGNHDYWSKTPFDGIAKAFAASGGAWLTDAQTVTSDGQFSIIGAKCRSSGQAPIKARADTRNIFLMHYPAWVKQLKGEQFDLILAGHSHGGQVRIPFYGPLMVPFGVDEFDMGMFKTAAGPLYVNPGIGWFPVPLRFNCRPEVTVFEI
jgi:predicted MPP superfamily phosphohydrolase